MKNLRGELDKRKLQGVPNDAPPIRENQKQDHKR